VLSDIYQVIPQSFFFFIWQVAAQTHCSYPADVWSFGVVLFTMLAGRAPFRGQTVDETLGMVKRGQFDVPKHFSPGARNIIEEVIVLDASKRPTSEQLCEHQYLRSHTHAHTCNPPPTPPSLPPPLSLFPPPSPREYRTQLIVSPRARYPGQDITNVAAIDTQMASDVAVQRRPGRGKFETNLKKQ
jgi:serine/threonine protein kinase